MRKSNLLFSLFLSGVLACPSSKTEDAEKPKAKVVSAKGLPPPAKPDAPETKSDSFVELRKEAEIRLQRLEGWVIRGASDAENPWALSHGILAFGAEHLATDGRPAIEVMVEDFAVWKGKGANKFIDFPSRTKGDHPIEPHNNLITNALVQAGVPQTKIFKLKSGGTVRLAQLIDRVRDEAETPKNPKDWHDFAWTYGSLLHAGAKPKNMDVKTLAADALDYVESQQAFLTELMRKGQPDKVIKKKQFIYAHTCGGIHLIQAALLGVQHLRDPKSVQRAKTQVETLIFRWKAERRIYREMRRKHPMYSLLLMAQELKFYGHLLETLALAHRVGLFPPSDAGRATIAPIVRDLTATIDGLAVNFIDLESVRAAKKQVYYDLIGDGCHAIRGLRESLMAFFPRK
jgi:hypothetical protein